MAERQHVRRRDLLRAALFGGAAVAGTAVPAAAKAGRSMGASRTQAVYDVAYLGDKERYTPILPFPGITDPLTGVTTLFDPANNGTFRAWLTYREGNIYTGGTIPEERGWDPASATPLGLIVSWGVFTEQVPERSDPQAVTTHVYILGTVSTEQLFPPDQLTSIGQEFVHADEEGMFSGWTPGRVPQPGIRSVTGGLGAFAGATGSVTQRFLGTNTTAAEPVFSHNPAFGHSPRNYRFEFDLWLPVEN